MNKQSFYDHLTGQIIPFWNNMLDKEHGGFYGAMDYDMNIIKDSEKSTILNSRILWFYSKAYMELKEESLLRTYAKAAYAFFKEHCFDGKNGGIYWSLNCDGSVCDSTKHTYNLAFAIYALSAYYRACKEKEVLELAYSLFDTIESKCRDKEGYLEAFNIDFTPASNEKLSENGVMAGRTMNTLLHVMEAYTELYFVDHNKKVYDKLCEILDIYHDHVFDMKKERSEVFFDMEYNSLIDLTSYGHDIESSWLIDRTLEALENEAYTNKMLPITNAMVRNVYAKAYDREQKALNNECENGIIDTQKIWWVQAESVIGFYNAYQKTKSVNYLNASKNIWKFILSDVVDKRSGEWFESVKKDGSIDKTQGLAHGWKCPYHNGRMCLEMLQRLS